MSAPLLGLLLTNLPDVEALDAALALADADVAGVIPLWGLDTGPLTPDQVRQIARGRGRRRRLAVRTTWGDPSCRLADGEDRRHPFAGRVEAELAPILDAVAGDALVIIGNEPLLEPQDSEDAAHLYASHLAQAVRAVRTRWPAARIVAPAHTRNAWIRLGDEPNGQRRWDEICGYAYRQCHALGLHAYTVSQAVSGLHELRDVVSATMPIWVTEFALNEPLPPVTRAARYLEILRALPVEGALLYHLCATAGSDPMHFNPHYTLDDATLAALGSAGPPDTVIYRERIERFTMAVIQWRTVAAFRRHLAQYQAHQVAPWARGVTLHCTEKPLPGAWQGIASMIGMARFYRDTRKWLKGPHLYSVSGAPNPLHDGIWQLCPLNEQGIHAASFNRSHWGWEVVDNPSVHRWDAGTAAFALGGIAALHDWAGWEGVTRATLNGHRDDPQTDKTCPGAAIDLAAVRRGVAALRQG